MVETGIISNLTVQTTGIMGFDFMRRLSHENTCYYGMWNGSNSLEFPAQILWNSCKE
jgi:hypothetical protein